MSLHHPGAASNDEPTGAVSCRWPFTLALIGLAFLGQAAAVAANPNVSREYQVKAAYLYNFAKFVEWPAQTFPAADSPIVIGAYCAEPFIDVLSQLVRDRRINGRILAVQQIEGADEDRSGHVVFVCSENMARLPDIEEALRDDPVLIVTESEEREGAHGIIQFVRIGDKVRFEIDMQAAHRAGLDISAQLQKLALTVRPAR